MLVSTLCFSQSPAIDTLKEVEAFLAANPSEIVTLILEDYVESPNGLTKVFNASGLMKYWFPVSNMPQNGQDWPLVKDMVANNQRLIVFTTERKKQESEGIAYQWNYMVENMCKSPVLCQEQKQHDVPLNTFYVGFKLHSLKFFIFIPHVVCFQHRG